MTTKLKLSLIALGLLTSQTAFATLVTPPWARDLAYTTYQGWDIFSTPAGPNAPNTVASGAAVPADPFNPNGTANAFDTSGQSFVLGDGNIYSFAAPTHINVVVPQANLGTGYDTTVLFQTRTQGNEPIYTGNGGYRLTYTDATGSHTILPKVAAEQDRTALGGFGGALVDYSVAFDIPGSPSSFTVNLDATDVSMSFDQANVDTIVTRATAASPLLSGMNTTVGFVPVAVPEPTGIGAVLIGGTLLVRRRRAKAAR